MTAPPRTECDVAVLGAGVVGLACAARLASVGRACVVLERHARFGQETSSRNSQVVHAGIHYAPGSLKAELCVRGNTLLYEWCARRDVFTARVGKLVVATSLAEEAELDTIASRAAACGVTLRRITGAEVSRLEPRVRATSALLSETSGIVDAHELMASLAAALKESGSDVAYRHELVGVSRTASSWRLALRDPSGAAAELDAACVVNAAGLDADRVAALAGVDVDEAGYRLRFVKGSYFRVRGASVVRRLVYPVPPRDLAGLGIHATVERGGAVRLGPDAEPLAGRVLDYRVDESRREAFAAAAARYLDGLGAGDLAPDQVGIRPKLGRAGEPPRDFVVREETDRGMPGWVDLVGIESPGLTAALAIAERVADLV